MSGSSPSGSATGVDPSNAVGGRGTGRPRPATVLLVQHYPDGGSITGLLDLVRGLDHDRFRPLVSFREPNPFVDELRAAGAEVVILADDPHAPATSERSETSGDAPSAPPRVPSPPRRRRWSNGRREVRRLLRRDLPHAWRLRRIIQTRGVDLVHANNDVLSNRDAVIAAVLARVPVVVHVRWIHHYRRDATLAIDKALATRVSAFICMSRAIADGCRPLGIPADRVTVLDDPFDPSDYVVAPSATLRRELGLDAEDRVVAHIGRIVAWNGQDVFLRAMVQVVEEEPTALALVVGGPADGDGFRDELDALVDDLGIAARVRFAGPRRDIPEVLALAEVLVHSSTDPEPFGRVVVEGMAAGRVVVGADAGGVPEIIDAGATGLLVPPGDPARLAAAVRGSLADPEAAREMGQRARDAVLARFSLDGHARAVEGIYTRVLAQSRRGAARG